MQSHVGRSRSDDHDFSVRTSRQGVGERVGVAGRCHDIKPTSKIRHFGDLGKEDSPNPRSCRLQSGLTTSRAVLRTKQRKDIRVVNVYIPQINIYRLVVAGANQWRWGRLREI